MITMSNSKTPLERLAPITGPMGPFISIDEHLEAREAWKSSLSLDVIPLLLDGLRLNDQELEKLLVEPEEGKALMVEGLGALGTQHFMAVKEAAIELLSSPTSRIHGIALLGELKSAEGLPELDLLISSNLPRDEAIQLACSLGEIGGEKAQDLVLKLKSLFDNDPEVQQECNLALA